MTDIHSLFSASLRTLAPSLLVSLILRFSPAAQRSEPSWKLTNFYPYYRLKYFKPCTKSDFCRVGGGGCDQGEGVKRVKSMSWHNKLLNLYK